MTKDRILTGVECKFSYYSPYIYVSKLGCVYVFINLNKNVVYVKLFFIKISFISFCYFLSILLNLLKVTENIKKER